MNLYDVFHPSLPLTTYELIKKEQIMMLYDFSNEVSDIIVRFGSKMNNKMVSHWFVDSVATYISYQENINEQIENHITKFYHDYILSFGQILPESVEYTEFDKIRAEHYALLDTATRHLKKFQKELKELILEGRVAGYVELCTRWNTLYICCDLLKIPVLEYCKETYIPYKKVGELYEEFYEYKPELEPHSSGSAPMLKVGYFYPIIKRLENKKKIN